MERDISVSRRSVFATGAGAAAVVVAGMTLAEQAQAQANSSSKLREILDRGKLVVGTGSTNPPWHFEDETGQLVGMDIDMARLFAKGLFDDPNKVEFVRQGSDARIPNLVTNKIDLLCQFMTITPGRARQIEFTTPYYREGLGLMAATGGKYKSFDELKAAGSSATIAWMQNVFVEEYTRKILPEINIIQLESIDATYQALSSGRADVTASDQSAIRWMVQKFPDRYVDTGFGWLPNTYAFGVAPGDPVWLNWLNTVVKEAFLGVDFDYMASSYKKWFAIDLKIPSIGYPSEYGAN